MRGLVYRSFVCFEGASVILFFGSLAGNAGLIEAGEKAHAELRARGYTVASESQPVRVYSAQSGHDLEERKGASWQPGRIFLRESPAGSSSAAVYLRHELMHEAVHRTCGEAHPIWAAEAAAIAFSGELAKEDDVHAVSSSAWAGLRRRAALGSPLDIQSYAALKVVLVRHGWPQAACEIPAEIAAQLKEAHPIRHSPLSWVVLGALSGEVLEESGDITGEYPPGSLLKVAYAAALAGDGAYGAGDELLQSDTASLARRWRHLSRDVYRLILSAGSVEKAAVFAGGEKTLESEQVFCLLGERCSGGDYAAVFSLRELARILRTALLIAPDRFSALAHNGFSAGSTLFAANKEGKVLLGKLRAVSKTGTASTPAGEPLAGHLFLAWPAEAPAYLAVIRRGGTRGSGVLEAAEALLSRWVKEYSPGYKPVRVMLLSGVRPEEREVLEDCPGFDIQRREGSSYRATTCGEFRIVANARGSRSERIVAGIFERSAAKDLLLVASPESYAAAVLESEAAHLAGEAREALRAVVMWNGMHGAGRHSDTTSLCDLTHCMVFRGFAPGRKREAPRCARWDLLLRLDELARINSSSWLHFSKGGAEKWEHTLGAGDIADIFGEEMLLDVQRERKRDGAVSIHLEYGQAAEDVPCEVLRRSLKLPSCPAGISYQREHNQWVFRGIGAGHGLGLSVAAAQELADAGKSASEILENAYGKEEGSGHDWAAGR